MRSCDDTEIFADILSKKGRNKVINCIKALENCIEQSSFEQSLKFLEDF